ncbi:hypothetical protein PoB_000557800 [Plakobranchus ocellatus]|uniref:Uncharacterized protein n=1 Tax=Plakobranchus ocellatus TaxID=259542 RepID=A0AAV3YAA2_9GAST|nr:hypothetical protein PoB_000557800 [Plakobranchus ocellatus]
MWDPFVQALSKETGRTVQDLNTLGLSDPTISKLWAYYSSNVQTLAAQQQQQQQQQPLQQQQQQSDQRAAGPTTTPPPFPDIYQSAYAFSSNNVNSQSTSSTPKSGLANSGSASTNSLYNELLNLMKRTPSAVSGSGSNYMSVLQLLSNSSPAKQTVSTGPMSSPSPSQISYQTLMDQYLSLTGKSGSGNSTSTSTGGQSSYEQLLQQFNSLGSSSQGSSQASPSYQTLVDLYKALMSQSAGTNSASSSSSTSSTNAAASPSASGASATPTASSATANSQSTFEEQLKKYFPQFQSLFPMTSQSSAQPAQISGTPTSSQTSQSAVSPSKTEQMIFDALLFADPPKASPQTSSSPSSSPATAASSSSSASSLSSSASGNSSPASGPQTNVLQQSLLTKANTGNMITNHMENVFKARASRDMGCRFLPEILELDMMPTSPLNCFHKCPLPYINSQRFGIFCLCCPPGVNNNVANVMSIFKRASYMESPFTVVS